ERSHWSGNGVHVESELVFMIGRNMHQALFRLISLFHPSTQTHGPPHQQEQQKYHQVFFGHAVGH
ncbi:hypothetical protein, partial [Aeromonas sp. QDB48]|uniref:hypothetical protein n=1 Tax=Aeromonas sp. QDB48 TaxID=2990492 RepID=UPI0022E58242